MTTGSNCIHIGYQCGYSTTTSTSNTGIGYQALYYNTTGLENTAIGFQALHNATGGTNTSVGLHSGLAVTSGHSNTFLGRGAGANVTTGYGNTVLGVHAVASSAGAINEFTLGAGSVGALRCQQTSITALSDGRDKKDKKPLEYGLDFLNKTKPVSFTWDLRNPDENDARQGKRRAGFIAQDLKALNDETDGVLDLVYESNPQKLEARYSNLVPVMVKAIQELSQQVTDLQTQIKKLEGTR